MPRVLRRLLPERRGPVHDLELDVLHRTGIPLLVTRHRFSAPVHGSLAPCQADAVGGLRRPVQLCLIPAVSHPDEQLLGDGTLHRLDCSRLGPLLRLRGVGADPA